jgi:hypothetical protein
MGWFDGLSKKVTAVIEMPLYLSTGWWCWILENGLGVTGK